MITMPRFIFFITFFFLATTPLLSFSQKVAIVDIDSVIICMPETKVAMGKLDSVVSRLQSRLNFLSDSLVNTIKDAGHELPGESETAKKERNEKQKKQLAEAQKMIGQWQANAQVEIENFQKKLRDPLEKKAKELSIVIAKKNGFTVLLDQSDPGKGIVYSGIDPTDITPMVIKNL